MTTSLYLFAETPRGTSTDDTGTDVVDAALHTPWGDLAEMMFADASTPVWEPLDVARAKAELTRKFGHVRFRAGELEAQTKNISRVTAGIFVPEPQFGANGRSQARQALERMLGHLPETASGRIVIDELADPVDAKRWFERHGIEELPPPLKGMPWLVALPRGNEDPAIPRSVYDAVLAMPAVSTETRVGRVWLQLYDDPFDYDAPATVQRIRKLSAYLARS